MDYDFFLFPLFFLAGPLRFSAPNSFRALLISMDSPFWTRCCRPFPTTARGKSTAPQSSHHHTSECRTRLFSLLGKCLFVRTRATEACSACRFGLCSFLNTGFGEGARVYSQEDMMLIMHGMASAFGHLDTGARLFSVFISLSVPACFFNGAASPEFTEQGEGARGRGRRTLHRQGIFLSGRGHQTRTIFPPAGAIRLDTKKEGKKMDDNTAFGWRRHTPRLMTGWKELTKTGRERKRDFGRLGLG